jgi:hypothetical protein
MSKVIVWILEFFNLTTLMLAGIFVYKATIANKSLIYVIVYLAIFGIVYSIFKILREIFNA